MNDRPKLTPEEIAKAHEVCGMSMSMGSVLGQVLKEATEKQASKEAYIDLLSSSLNIFRTMAVYEVITAILEESVQKHGDNIPAVRDYIVRSMLASHDHLIAAIIPQYERFLNIAEANLGDKWKVDSADIKKIREEFRRIHGV